MIKDGMILERDTLCHQFLMAVTVFGVPSESFSLPARAVLHALQATFLRLLSPQFPFIFWSVSMCTRAASSTACQHAEFFSLFVLDMMG